MHKQTLPAAIFDPSAAMLGMCISYCTSPWLLPFSLFLLYSLSFFLAKTRNCEYNKKRDACAESTSGKGLRAMGDTQWENCGAETLLEE